MKWTEKQVDKLCSLCRSGRSNGELAEIFGVHKTEIYAKRSELHYTIAEVEAERKREKDVTSDNTAAKETIDPILAMVKIAKEALSRKMVKNGRMSELEKAVYAYEHAEPA